MMKPIEYNYDRNTHSVSGPQAALPLLLGNLKPASLLDVGCGIGTWLSVAQGQGIVDVLGVDGIDVPESSLLVSKQLFLRHDLTQPLDLGRKFEVAFCLEVAEHLEADAGDTLITSLAKHADTIFFSAASPGQPGEHHVNCQWPSYWQSRFNAFGFACYDEPRWKIWTDSRIEFWYRQNIFCARREGQIAGTEPRIKPVLHPDLLPGYPKTNAFSTALNQINDGCMPASWYLRTSYAAICSKILRRIS
jgi:SAM-dependent methyltransferase